MMLFKRVCFGVSFVLVCVLLLEELPICSPLVLPETHHVERSEGKLIGQARVAMYSGRYGEQAMANLSEYRTSLFKRTMQLYTQHMHNASASPSLHVESFALWAPYLQCPPGMPLERVPGADPLDAAKWMCALPNQTAPCVIYSLGSRNEFVFEDHMVNTTPCSIHTFDCTVQSQSRGSRIHFHRICVGRPPAESLEKELYKTLPEVQAMLGHTHVHIMKMDIEGFEYDALEDWKEYDNLPDQLLLEIHYTFPQRENVKTVTTPAEMSLFFAHLTNLGYGIVGAERNSNYGTCCAELGLLKVESLQPLRLRRGGMQFL